MKPDPNIVRRKRDGLEFARLMSDPTKVFCGGCKSIIPIAAIEDHDCAKTRAEKAAKREASRANTSSGDDSQ